MAGIGRCLWPTLLYLWGIQTVVGIVITAEGSHFWRGEPDLVSRIVFGAVYCLGLVLAAQLVVLRSTQGTDVLTQWRRSPFSWSFLFVILSVFGNLLLFYVLVDALRHTDTVT